MCARYLARCDLVRVRASVSVIGLVRVRVWVRVKVRERVRVTVTVRDRIRVSGWTIGSCVREGVSVGPPLPDSPGWMGG